jgi:dolichyl-phosphate beta-glucosyltransferase
LRFALLVFSFLRLSVIIPAYNEADRIRRTLLDVHQYLAKQSFDSEIIVISDGSTDDTVKITEGLKDQIQNLWVIANTENRGKGFVVRQAMLAAKGEIRLFMDADNATTVDHFDRMKPFFCGLPQKNGQQSTINIQPSAEACYDVVIGSRRIEGAEIAVHQPFYKEWLGRLGNLPIRLFVVGGIPDTQCGFKAFSAQAARDIFSRTTLDHWGFDFEVLAIARKLGYRIKQVPVRWVNDPTSKVKLSAYPKTLLEALNVRKNLWTGAYTHK